MELRTYGKIIRRYIWVIVLIVGVVALYDGYQYYKLRKAGALVTYNSNISILIGLEATTKGDPNPADNVTVSEARADTLVTNSPILTSDEFNTDISHQIGLDMSEIQQRYGPHPDLGSWQTPSAIASALSATRTHSLVTISINWGTKAGAWAIANAIGEISTARIGQYLDYVVATNYTHPATNGVYVQPAVSARVISAASDPTTVPGSSTSKVTLLILLLLIALAIGIALAFFLDYLDDRLHSKQDVQDLFQLPIYGEIPRAPTPGHIQSPQPHDTSVA